MVTTDPGLEGLNLSAYVYQRLAQDPALVGMLGAASHITEGPATQEPPFVTFTILDPQDVKVVGMIQVMARVEVQVRVTIQGSSYATARPIYKRVHQLLEAQSNQVAGGGQLLTIHRVSAVQFPERENGIDYRHIGGLYQAHVQ